MVYQQLRRYGIRQFKNCTNAVRSLPYTSISRRHCTSGIFQPQVPLVNQDFSFGLCGAVAGLLNRAGVENLLWGTHLQAAYTVPVVVPVSFLNF